MVQQLRDHRPMSRATPEPELEVRLHSPRPGVVVVRASGVVDEPGADLLGERVGQQLTRAVHVLVDMSAVRVLCQCGTKVLAELDRDATRRGICLHITGVEDTCVREQLHHADLESEPSTDAVVALLPALLPRRRRTY